MNLSFDPKGVNSVPFTEQLLYPASGDLNKASSVINILKGHEEFILDTKGVIISSNLEAVNITGYEEWEVMGKHISLFYTPEDILLNQPQEDLRTAEEKGELTLDVLRLKKKQTQFWAKVRIIPLYNSIRALTGFKMILKDATYKAYYNFKLKKIEDEYLNLLHNSVVGIFKFNPKDRKVILFNNKAIEILGVSNIEDLKFDSVFSNRNDYETLISILEDQKQVSCFECKMHSTQIQERWMSIDCRYYIDQNFAEGIILDITDRKLQELEVNRLSKELDNFIYHASHDLRSPLSSILGLVNLIHTAKPANPIKQYTEMIGERVHHLDMLLKDLSTITFNNHAEPYFERVFLKEEIKGILKEFAFQSNNIQAHIDINEEREFSSDIIRFRTIMRNLISNAMKFYNPIAKNPYIKIAIHADKSRVKIVVEDNGIGMDDIQLMQIYNMFNRGHSTLSGSGLGLYIVKSMTDKLEGSLKVNSALGRGTTFTIELPNQNK